ncbi:hypothetical protein NECAME_18766, partial [Necator americanus]
NEEDPSKQEKTKGSGGSGTCCGRLRCCNRKRKSAEESTSKRGRSTYIIQLTTDLSHFPTHALMLLYNGLFRDRSICLLLSPTNRRPMQLVLFTSDVTRLDMRVHSVPHTFHSQKSRHSSHRSINRFVELKRDEVLYIS